MTAAIYWFICTRASYASAIPKIAADQKDFNRKAANALAGLARGRHDVGDLLARPVDTPVNDHLLCDGSEVSRLGFPQLYATIADTWGAGDGTTTFNLPNLIGTTLPVPPSAPPQVITGTTVSTGAPIDAPTDPGQVGGTTGGNVPTGGRNRGRNERLPEQ